MRPDLTLASNTKSLGSSIIVYANLFASSFAQRMLLIIIGWLRAMKCSIAFRIPAPSIRCFVARMTNFKIFIAYAKICIFTEHYSLDMNTVCYRRFGKIFYWREFGVFTYALSFFIYDSPVIVRKVKIFLHIFSVELFDVSYLHLNRSLNFNLWRKYFYTRHRHTYLSLTEE